MSDVIEAAVSAFECGDSYSAVVKIVARCAYESGKVDFVARPIVCVVVHGCGDCRRCFCENECDIQIKRLVVGRVGVVVCKILRYVASGVCVFIVPVEVFLQCVFRELRVEIRSAFHILVRNADVLCFVHDKLLLMPCVRI